MFDHNVDEDCDDPGEEDHDQLSAANTAVAVGSIALLEHEMFVDTCYLCCCYYLCNISQSGDDLQCDGEKWNINKNISVGEHELANINREDKTAMTLLVHGEYLDQNCVQKIAT